MCKNLAHFAASTKVICRAKPADGPKERGWYYSPFLPILRAAVHVARSSLSITVDEKNKGLRAVWTLFENCCDEAVVPRIQYVPIFLARECKRPRGVLRKGRI